jgi:RNA polymerase sigma-70 factor (ECF subfamily)
MATKHKAIYDQGCDLMVRVSHGDQDAFERLVTLFQKNVINTIYRYLGDACVAEDLAQDVFLKIYQARARYKPLARFETWLHRIVYNVVVNEAQSRKRRKALSLDTFQSRQREAMEFAARGSREPLDQLKREELFEKVREAVMVLPSQQRMVLVLNKYQDMSYQAIAETLDTSVEAVKSMLFRAREKVRAKLKGYVGSEVYDETDL